MISKLSFPCASLLVVLAAGCADCSGGAHVTSDGGADAGPPPIFDPSTTYPGEGTACRFSVACGERQLCVDDQCIRHERIDASSLHFAEWRQMTDAELDASPMYVGRRYDWDAFYESSNHKQDLIGVWGPQTWTTPGVDTPWYVFHQWHGYRCQLVVVGPSVHLLSPTNAMSCFAATVSEDGWVAAAGVRDGGVENHVVVWNPNHEEVLDVPIPQAVHDRLAQPENWGFGAQAGPVNALYFRGGQLYATVRKGGATGLTLPYMRTNSSLEDSKSGLAFLEIDVDGAMRVHPIGGLDVHTGRLGWIAEDSGGLLSFQSTYVGPNPEDITFDIMRWDTGVRTPQVTQLGSTGRYLQLTHDHWVAVLDFTPICGYTILDSLAAPFSHARVQMGCPTVRDFATYTGGGRTHYYWQGPFPQTAAYTGIQDSFTQESFGAYMQLIVTQYNRLTNTDSPETVVGSVVSNGATDTRANVLVRYGKSYEMPFLDEDNGTHLLGWLERALTRTNDGGI